MRYDTMHARTLALTVLVAVMMSNAAATPQLDGVSFDPAFPAAGDTVEVAMNLHETQYPDKSWEPVYTLDVRVVPDDRVTAEHTTVLGQRDDSIGFLYPEGYWNERTRIKIDSDAPALNYSYRVELRYLDDGEPVQIETDEGTTTATVIERFEMPVDAEGIDLEVGTIEVSPQDPRPDDDGVDVTAEIVNTGEQRADSVIVHAGEIDGIEPADGADNRVFLGSIGPDGSADAEMTYDVGDDISPSVHDVPVSFRYEDQDSTAFEDTTTFPLRIEGRPQLAVQQGSISTVKAGGSALIRFTVENTGEQDAESSEVRILPKATQPISMVDRSMYLGEIQAGEEATATMRVQAERSASQQRYNLDAEIRSLGDSEEGDSSVYTESERVTVEVAGVKQSLLLPAGILGAVLVAGVLAYRRTRGGDDDGE
jgi:hypothetical protein